MKQKFNLKIEFPEGWKLNNETLKTILETETIFKIIEIRGE
jgi:hypothetical protein